MFLDYQYPDNVVIRSDNGSQFIAKSVREYFSLIGVYQELTHVATPEGNAKRYYVLITCLKIKRVLNNKF